MVKNKLEVGEREFGERDTEKWAKKVTNTNAILTDSMSGNLSLHAWLVGSWSYCGNQKPHKLKSSQMYFFGFRHADIFNIHILNNFSILLLFLNVLWTSVSTQWSSYKQTCIDLWHLLHFLWMPFSDTIFDLADWQTVQKTADWSPRRREEKN